MGKKLHITISGEPGSGKTTITAGIVAVLADAGFQVAVDDPDMEHLDDVLNPDFKKRIAALLAAGLEVTVETVQLQREATENPEPDITRH